MSKKIIIYGAGSSGIEILKLIFEINKVDFTWEVIGFIDPNIKKKIYGIKTYKDDKLLIKSSKKIYFVCSIFNNILKQKIIKKINKNFIPTNLIHPRLEIPEDLKIGKGNIIFSNTHLSYNLKIGNHNIISFACDLGHDLKMGNYNSIAPGTIINGKVKISNLCQIGSGVIINFGTTINSNAKVGSGTFLAKNVSKNKNIYQIPRFHITKN